MYYIKASFDNGLLFDIVFIILYSCKVYNPTPHPLPPPTRPPPEAGGVNRKGNTCQKPTAASRVVNHPQLLQLLLLQHLLLLHFTSHIFTFPHLPHSIPFNRPNPPFLHSSPSTLFFFAFNYTQILYARSMQIFRV